MQINISARHGHLAPTTQDRITEKVQVVRKFYDRITSIQVTVDLEHRERPDVELRVTAEHHDDFVATETADNALAALDSVIDKVEQQLRKHKERLKDHKVTGHKHLPPPTNDDEE